MIYAFSSGKFYNVMVYACVKDLTNIMFDPHPPSEVKHIIKTEHCSVSWAQAKLRRFGFEFMFQTSVFPKFLWPIVKHLLRTASLNFSASNANLRLREGELSTLSQLKLLH